MKSASVTFESAADAVTVKRETVSAVIANIATSSKSFDLFMVLSPFKILFYNRLAPNVFLVGNLTKSEKLGIMVIMPGIEVREMKLRVQSYNFSTENMIKYHRIFPIWL